MKAARRLVRLAAVRLAMSGRMPWCRAILLINVVGGLR